MPAFRTNDTESNSDDDYYIPTRKSRPLPKRKSKVTPRVSSTSARRSPSSASSTLVSDASAYLVDDIHEPATCVAAARGTEPIVVSGVTLRPTIAFDTFWRVAAERKAIDDKRRAGLPRPWTDDAILRDYFFCNTFRVLDKGCQYLIREVIEKGSQEPNEVVFRVILYNTFTKIATWELLDNALGPLTWKTYDREKYINVLASCPDSLYTGAFIKPAPSFGYKENYANHLCLLESFMEHELSRRLLVAPSMADVFEYLVSFPSMGEFSTYQLILCLSYTKVLNFHENDLVVPGPGSTSGLNKLFGSSMQKGRNVVQQFDIDVMRYLTASQDYHFKRLGIEFSGLGPKRLPMSVADIEHMLCEVDKYCRRAHPQLKAKRTNITRMFKTGPSTTTYADAPLVIPKAWAHRARRTPRIREETKLTIHKRYVVSHISDHRDDPDGRKFLVYWVGYPDSDATWEFESSLLLDAPATITEYFARRSEGGQATNPIIIMD